MRRPADPYRKRLRANHRHRPAAVGFTLRAGDPEGAAAVSHYCHGQTGGRMSVRKPIPVCWRRERRYAAEGSMAKAWHKEIRKTDCQALDFAQIRSMDKPPACRTLRTMAGLE